MIVGCRNPIRICHNARNRTLYFLEPVLRARVKQKHPPPGRWAGAKRARLQRLELYRVDLRSTQALEVYPVDLAPSAIAVEIIFTDLDMAELLSALIEGN